MWASGTPKANPRVTLHATSFESSTLELRQIHAYRNKEKERQDSTADKTADTKTRTGHTVESKKDTENLKKLRRPNKGRQGGQPPIEPNTGRQDREAATTTNGRQTKRDRHRQAERERQEQTGRL